MDKLVPKFQSIINKPLSKLPFTSQKSTGTFDTDDTNFCLLQPKDSDIMLISSKKPAYNNASTIETTTPTLHNTTIYKKLSKSTKTFISSLKEKYSARFQANTEQMNDEDFCKSIGEYYFSKVIKAKETMEVLRNASKETIFDTLWYTGSFNYPQSPYPTDFLLFANGNKPAILIGGKKKIRNPTSLSSEKVDVIIKNPLEHCIILLNKTQVKAIIEKNKEIYCNRLELSDNTPVDKIYKKLLKTMNKEHKKIADIFGITMGYPKYNCMIFQLSQFLRTEYKTNDFIAGNIENSKNIDKNSKIQEFKTLLKMALIDPNSPYKNLDKSSPVYKRLEKSIDNIQEVMWDRKPCHTCMDFVYYTPEPEEIERISRDYKTCLAAIQEGKRLTL